MLRSYSVISLLHVVGAGCYSSAIGPITILETGHLKALAMLHVPRISSGQSVHSDTAGSEHDTAFTFPSGQDRQETILPTFLRCGLAAPAQHYPLSK